MHSRSLNLGMSRSINISKTLPSLIELKISEKNIARNKSGHKIRKNFHYDQNKTELHLVNPAHLVTLKLESQIALSSRDKVKAR